MIIWFVLVFSIIGLALAVALYSSFLPYFSLLSDIKNYNIAYYGAQTAVERSLSVLRYREAWFEWSGGWVWTTPSWPVSDYQNEYLSDNIRSLAREIQWRTDGVIPRTWQGNIEYRLLSWTSNEYNMLSYHTPLRLPLSVDETLWSSAYSTGSDQIISYDGNGFEIQLRLNPVIRAIFDPADNAEWRLCNDEDNSGDSIRDDVIVDRWRRGKFDWQDFSIIPRNMVRFNTWTNTWLVDMVNDASIRESDVNSMTTTNSDVVVFWNTINPLDQFREEWTLITGHLMIASQEVIENIGTSSFEDLLGDTTNITDQELTLFLARLLETCWDDIYPFLEYRIVYDGGWDQLPDPWFRIHGKWQAGWYTVNIYVRKSTNRDDTLSSFTVVF